MRKIQQAKPAGRAQAAVTSEDVAAFRAAVRDVKPLPPAAVPAGLAPSKPRRRKRPRAADRTDADALMPLLAPSEVSAESAPPELLSFKRGGVRTLQMRRLRRGLYPSEAELDLHGLNQSAARDLLAEFIRASRDAQMRCVRVIHGKGYRSGARGPVLKTAVNLWLRHHVDVMAFTSAKTIDGGSGALYVLLRA